MTVQRQAVALKSLESPFPDGLAHIREARARFAEETDSRLQEQAQLRADALARAVPASALWQSREEDLLRLEEEKRQSEYRAIEVIEKRMESALRAIEADNQRIVEEERAQALAQERLAQAQEAMSLARGRQEEEVRLTVQIRQRAETEQRLLALAERRMSDEAALTLAMREKESLERRQGIAVQEQISEVALAARVLTLQRQLRASRRWGGLLATLCLGMATTAVILGWVGYLSIPSRIQTPTSANHLKPQSHSSVGHPGSQSLPKATEPKLPPLAGASHPG